MYSFIRTFWRTSTKPTGTAPSLLSPPPNQTSPWRWNPPQRSPRNRRRTVTLETVANRRRTCPNKAVDCLLWRMHHAGQCRSLPWKIHTTLIVTPAPFSPWHFLLSISSTGCTIYFSERPFPSCSVVFSFTILMHLYLHIQDLVAVATVWTQSDHASLLHQTKSCEVKGTSWVSSLYCSVLKAVIGHIWMD